MTLEETLQHLENAIKQIISPEVTKIGIGVPTYVDSEKGIVYDAMNIPSWTVVPLKERLEKAFNIPIAVNNDANCFVLGAAALLDKPSSVIAVVSCGQNVVKESMVHLFQTQNEKACRSGGGSSMSRMGLSGPLP